jgi:hypothetical protein
MWALAYIVLYPFVVDTLFWGYTWFKMLHVEWGGSSFSAYKQPLV